MLKTGNCVLIPSLCLMVLIFSCTDEKHQSVTEQYIQLYEEINQDSCYSIYVLPKYACASCVKSVHHWLEDKIEHTGVLVITDVKEYTSYQNVIFDNVPDRITQYNPYYKDAYAFSCKRGKVEEIVKLDLTQLEGLDEVHTKLKAECF